MEVLNENCTVYVEYRGNCVFIKIKDISIIESQGNYSKIYFNNDSITVHKSLKYLEEKLGKNIFFRANKKYIINKNMVYSIDAEEGGTFFYMKIGAKIKVSRRQLVKLKNLLS